MSLRYSLTQPVEKSHLETVYSTKNGGVVMAELYTAVGRFERKIGEQGYSRPVVIVDAQEHNVSIPEMVVWTILNWRLLDRSQLNNLFDKNACQIAELEHIRCDEQVERMLQRGLIACGVGETDVDALYDLLNSLYVVPIISNPFVKLAAFFKFIVRDNISFAKAKEVFRTVPLSTEERRIIALTKQAHLSTAEVIKCVEAGVYDVSDEEKLMTALYDDDETTSDNIGSYAEQYDNKRPVLSIISNLYLRRLILFERIG